MKAESRVSHFRVKLQVPALQSNVRNHTFTSCFCFSSVPRHSLDVMSVTHVECLTGEKREVEFINQKNLYYAYNGVECGDKTCWEEDMWPTVLCLSSVTSLIGERCVWNIVMCRVITFTHTHTLHLTPLHHRSIKYSRPSDLLQDGVYLHCVLPIMHLTPCLLKHVWGNSVLNIAMSGCWTSCLWSVTAWWHTITSSHCPLQ